MPLVVDLAQSMALLGVEQRLSDMPASAMVRGIFFRLLKDDTEKRGIGAVEDLRALLRGRDVWRMYPARELMMAYAITASLIDANPHEGLRALFRGMASSYSQTWYGQLFRKVLGTPDPARAIRYVERARERISNYATWRLETVGPCHMVLHMIDEYFWIESAQRGGSEGVLDACEVSGEVRAELDGPYTGALDIQWTPRRG